MVYYLKVNEDSLATLCNLKQWLIVLSKTENAAPVIVCDNPTILTKIVGAGLALPGIRFISSERTNEDVVEIADAITNDRWRNAGMAHLTVFLDAAQQGYDRFWNIDADDTHICLSYQQTAEFLKKVEEDACNNNIHLYSLDMHTTRTDGVHWSFGISYTDNSVDWISEMKRMSKTKKWEELKTVLSQTNNLINIDMFFTYLRKAEKSLGIESFYIDNTYFIHYSKDFLALCIYSGVYYWANGRLYSPILSQVLQFEGFSEGEIIPKDVRKIDMEIELGDSLSEFQKYITMQHGREKAFEPNNRNDDAWKEIVEVLKRTEES